MHYGLDIGGTKIEIARYSNTFKQLDSTRVATPIDDYDDFIHVITQLVDDADRKSGEKGSMGIGIPGVLNPDTGLLLISNVPCANRKPVQDDLQNALNRSVVIENDARCFAYSEANGGAACAYERVFAAIIGTGAGGGFCIDGEIYHGANRASGEWGHLPVSAIIRDRYNLPLRKCGCGLTGCYEHYMAGPGIAKLHQHFGGEEIATPEIISRYRQQDAVAVRTFEAFIDITAAALANLVLTFDPDAVVMGGGLSKVPELYEFLPNAINRHLFSTLSAPGILAPMYGDSGGVRGAALLGSRQEIIL